MLATVLSPTAIYVFDGLEVLGSTIVNVHEELPVVTSFPDFNLSFEQIIVQSTGVVMISNILDHMKKLKQVVY
jgi:hypothetical protein